MTIAYCPNCGTGIGAGQRFCPSCARSVQAAPPSKSPPNTQQYGSYAQGRPVADPPGKGLATSPIILSVFGFCIPFGSIVGLILGIVAFNILKNAAAPTGLAVAGIVVGALDMLIGAVVGGLLAVGAMGGLTMPASALTLAIPSRETPLSLQGVGQPCPFSEVAYEIYRPHPRDRRTHGRPS